MEVALFTICHRLRGRLRREDAHQYQQKLTHGEKQAIVVGVEQMVLWCFPPT